MWNFKSVTLFVASLIVVILMSMSMANAEENKTITPKEFVLQGNEFIEISIEGILSALGIV